MKATCAVCYKCKSRFSEAKGGSTVGITNTEQVGLVDNEVNKLRETKVSKKLNENLLQIFIESVSRECDENES